MTIIDRFEGGKAVIETDGGMKDIPRTQLPKEAKEGDVIVYDNGAWRAAR